jgi:dienelactone hydrolase
MSFFMWRRSQQEPVGKAEIRRPKAERNPKPEGRSPKSLVLAGGLLSRWSCVSAAVVSSLSLGRRGWCRFLTSDFDLLSAFGFRPSGFTPPAVTCSKPRGATFLLSNGLLASLTCATLCTAGPATNALTAAQVQQSRKAICENFFIPDPLPALDAQIHRRFSPAPGVKAEAVSYTTQFGLRVPAILYLPDPLPAPASGKIPAFIVVNGHGGDKYCWYSWYAGILFARGGAAVLTYDQIGEGERNRDHKCGSRAHDNIKGDAVLARELMGLMITDVRQAVSYLAQRPDVDPQRIAAGGYSLGSFVLVLTGAVEPRLRACVMVGGGNLDGPNGRWDNSSKKMCESQPYRSLSFLGDRPAVIYALHAARGPALIFNGLGDSVVGIPKHGEPFFHDLRERTAQLHGGMAGVFDVGFAPTNASHRPYFLTRPVVLWLEKQLDFPNWSEASIKAMPETKIGPWAQTNGVLLDKLYATEEREAGTLALGSDIPGYSRDALDLFTPQEWQLRKKDFILETWVQAAQHHAPVLGAGAKPVDR